MKWILNTPELHSISSQQSYFYFNLQLVFGVNEAVLGLFYHLFILGRRFDHKSGFYERLRQTDERTPRGLPAGF